ncbi:MAG: YraN family protein [Phycisphaerae bacterium]|nr:YraN family protein [Phycisphaerae bacterium]
MGEKLSARFLRRQGYRIVIRNYVCPVGEIDLVALDGQSLVFVEVKTRCRDTVSNPESAVNFHKRRQITATANYYLLQTGAQNRPCRFDVVAVVLRDGLAPEMEHFVDAFCPTGT